MTVYLVISLPKIPYIHRIPVSFWPTLLTFNGRTVPLKKPHDCHNIIQSSHLKRTPVLYAVLAMMMMMMMMMMMIIVMLRACMRAG
jgi:hypothetical protein